MFSNRINDPAFARYVKNNNRWSAIFALILAVAAIVGFYIAGENGSEMENPESLYIGLGIGGMFIAIALLQIWGRKRSKTWDGFVIDKQVKPKKRKRYTDDDNYYWQEYREYVVVVRSDQGKLHELTAEDDDTVFNYYTVGDRVRHHGGLNSYEKADKSRDSIIFCNACGFLHDISAEYCEKCHCPLLK